MKILLAPSKTRNYNIKKSKKKLTEPKFIIEAEYLSSQITKYSKSELSKIMKIKDQLLDRTYDEYQCFNNAVIHSAISSYTGTVFKELEIDIYNLEQKKYLENHLRILSAMYGVLKPYDGVKYYRLDMNMKVLDISSYKYWKEKIDNVTLEDELIINLSSTEFSKMLNCTFINVEFKEKISNNIYKNIGVYSKMARGKMANYIIKNQIETLQEVLEFDLDRYLYNSEISTETNIVFTR